MHAFQVTGHFLQWYRSDDNKIFKFLNLYYTDMISIFIIPLSQFSLVTKVLHYDSYSVLESIFKSLLKVVCPVGIQQITLVIFEITLVSTRIGL